MCSISIFAWPGSVSRTYCRVSIQGAKAGIAVKGEDFYHGPHSIGMIHKQRKFTRPLPQLQDHGLGRLFFLL